MKKWQWNRFVWEVCEAVNDRQPMRVDALNSFEKDGLDKTAEQIRVLCRRIPTATHLAVMVCESVCSSHLTQRQVVLVGPECHYKTVEELKDSPSLGMWRPIAYCDIVRAPAEAKS